MGIVNRRNAVLGWLTWTVGKRAAKKPTFLLKSFIETPFVGARLALRCAAR